VTLLLIRQRAQVLARSFPPAEGGLVEYVVLAKLTSLFFKFVLLENGLFKVGLDVDLLHVIEVEINLVLDDFFGFFLCQGADDLSLIGERYVVFLSPSVILHTVFGATIISVHHMMDLV